MKTLFGIAFGIFALTFALSGKASAQAKHGRSINNRQHNQSQRIRQGVRSGELTAHETGRLAADQVRLRRQEARFRQSGDGLNLRERARLQQELSKESRRIYRQKHDGQDYPGGQTTP